MLTNFLDGGLKGRLLPMGPLFFGANETSGSVIPQGSFIREERVLNSFPTFADRGAEW